VHADAALRFNVSIGLYLVAIVRPARLLADLPDTVQVVPFLSFCNRLLFTAIAIQRAVTGQTVTIQ
jgi:hypothetical protein